MVIDHYQPARPLPSCVLSAEVEEPVGRLNIPGLSVLASPGSVVGKIRLVPPFELNLRRIVKPSVEHRRVRRILQLAGANR